MDVVGKIVLGGKFDPAVTLKEIRCPYCHTLIAKGSVSKIEFKCRKCGRVSTLNENLELVYPEK